MAKPECCEGKLLEKYYHKYNIVAEVIERQRAWPMAGLTRSSTAPVRSGGGHCPAWRGEQAMSPDSHETAS